MGGKEHFRAPEFPPMDTDGTPPLTKDALRRSMREKLRATTAGQRAAWSAEIVHWLKSDEAWLPQSGGTVALFGGVASEPDICPLLPWLVERGVRVVFFSIAGEVMVPRQVRGLEDLITGNLGVLEPDPARCPVVAVEHLDVVLKPGLAFSPLTGARLGRGKGYYDRALAGLPAGRMRIGVCFQLQLDDCVPREAHDLPVKDLVTEKGWIRVGD